MIKGYISQIDSASAQPSKITFKLRNERREFDLEEILELREKAWFRRGVALSDECNRNIAAKAMEKMYELREATGFPHQIIAAAMSIDHASRICEIFEELGVAAEFIHYRLPAEFIHYRLPAEEKTRVLDRLRDHSIDAIVQVAMLGEGFDHPPLGVAAIFRPYRSLSPYIQFIGRVMRTVDRKNPYGPDNRAYLVSHGGLNNEEQWSDFGLFDAEDQAVVRKLLHGNDVQGGVSGTGTSDGEVVGPIADEEDLSHFDSEAFLDPSDDRVIEEMLDTAGPGGVSYRDLGVTAEQLRAHLLHLRRREEPPPAQF
ncbi:DEAD/DEAH box helicase [Brevibacterium renqingii]|uniref:DEAD/DEAH box helicase n=1 Tax=Brevibacterium renqingii TaxID=2776916 RepID=UPI001ADFCA75|nr:helicase-related protein [Brevibacterium renqingii]